MSPGNAGNKSQCGISRTIAGRLTPMDERIPLTEPHFPLICSSAVWLSGRVLVVGGESSAEDLNHLQWHGKSASNGMQWNLTIKATYDTE